MSGHVRTSQGPPKHLGPQRVNNKEKTALSIGDFMGIKWLLSIVCYMPTAHCKLFNFTYLSQLEPLMAIKSFDSF